MASYVSLGGTRKHSNLSAFRLMLQRMPAMPTEREILGQQRQRYADEPSGSTGVSRESTISPTAAITRGSMVGTVSEVPLRDIVAHYKTSLTFKLAVFTYTVRSVGLGFYNTSDTTKPAGKKGIEIVNQFCEDWDMDTKNQKAARDAWMAGNFFWNKVAKPGRLLDGIYSLPLSSFTDIVRDSAGDPVWYIQQWGMNSPNRIPPQFICHFDWMPLDEEPFGEGLGQSLARTGLGYTTASGNKVARKSMFEIEEMVDDIVPEMIRAGMPRYVGTFPAEDGSFVNDVTNKLNHLDPQQHMILNAEGEIKTIALDTQSRHDTFIRYVSDKVITGTMSPLIRLWSSLDFTYASSKAAVEALDPSIDMYQRAHKRFVEKVIFRPLLLQNKIEPKDAQVRLNWGAEIKPTADDIIKIWSVLSDPDVKALYNLNDLIKMIQEAGYKINPILKDEVVAAQMAAKVVEEKAGEKKSEQGKTPKELGYNSIEELLGHRVRTT